MASFVLVHGSGQDAGCWARVAGELTARGHTVAAPDLPKQPPGWGLQRYADAIAAAVPGPDAVVVAHSLCGVFLPWWRSPGRARGWCSSPRWCRNRG